MGMDPNSLQLWNISIVLMMRLEVLTESLEHIQVKVIENSFFYNAPVIWMTPDPVHHLLFYRVELRSSNSLLHCPIPKLLFM
jgi:hypothetical protein